MKPPPAEAEPAWNADRALLALGGRWQQATGLPLIQSIRDYADLQTATTDLKVSMMEAGKVVLDGTADELRDNEDVKEFYLGGAGDQRKSFKNLKSFKRRKRWL